MMKPVRPIKNGQRFSHRDTAMILMALAHAVFPDRPIWIDQEIARHAELGRSFVGEVAERTVQILCGSTF